MYELNSLYIFMASYLISDFMYFYIFDRVLVRKYSLKTMVFITTVLWIIDCSVKLFPQYLWGITDETGIMSILMLFTAVVYSMLCFHGSFKKKVLISLLYMLVQVAMDLVGMKIAMLISGTSDLYSVEFLRVAIVCSNCTIGLGTVITAWAWLKFENHDWNIDKYQWFCLILPFSQYGIIQYTAMRSIEQNYHVSLLVACGAALSLFADIYMFWLFERINAKKRAESEMRKLSHQYEIEKMKFEQLKKVQEDTAKMRHEMQNYLMTIKNME